MYIFMHKHAVGTTRTCQLVMYIFMHKHAVGTNTHAPASLSCTSSCTNTRLAHTHVWPALRRAEATMPARERVLNACHKHTRTFGRRYAGLKKWCLHVSVYQMQKSQTHARLAGVTQMQKSVTCKSLLQSPHRLLQSLHQAPVTPSVTFATLSVTIATPSVAIATPGTCYTVCYNRHTVCYNRHTRLTWMVG